MCLLKRGESLRHAHFLPMNNRLKANKSKMSPTLLNSKSADKQDEINSLASRVSVSNKSERIVGESEEPNLVKQYTSVMAVM